MGCGKNEMSETLARAVGLLEAQKIQPVGNGFNSWCYKEYGLATAVQLGLLAS